MGALQVMANRADHRRIAQLRLKSVCPSLLGIAITTCLLAAGCGGSQLPAVTGSVSVDGKPAEGAVLLFHPDGGAAASTGSAVASADGTYSVITNMEPGLPPGRYKVTVTWPDPSVKPSERDIMMGTAEPGPDLLKGRYRSKAQSDLVVEVDSSTRTIPPFDLKSQ